MRRKSIRLRGYDYSSNGFYFVTICTAMRQPLLAKYGVTAELILRSLPEHFSGIEIDYYQFGANHLHVIFVLDGCTVSLSEIVRTYKALVTKATGCKNFWQWNYYEHVIRNERALYNIRKYIDEHPLKERIYWKEVYDDSKNAG